LRRLRDNFYFAISIAELPKNPCLMRNWKEYEWLMTTPERNNDYYRKGSWTWLFNRLCMSIKPVSGAENYYTIDASDAGKIVFLLTGIENTNTRSAQLGM
jgi:hypothetical protein